MSAPLPASLTGLPVRASQDNLKSGQARDDGQREEQDQERPKIEMPKLELPDLSGASDMARVLLSRAGRELEKRGLVNPTDRPPPPPEVMGERPLERAPSSPSIPLEVLEQLKQLSALARPALDALRSKLPTEPGTLLRLALVLCVVTWVGSGLGGNTIPAGENKVVQAQVEQAKKGAQEMTRVKQVRGAEAWQEGRRSEVFWGGEVDAWAC
jgi:hypothetical protein